MDTIQLTDTAKNIDVAQLDSQTNVHRDFSNMRMDLGLVTTLVQKIYENEAGTGTITGSCLPSKELDILGRGFMRLATWLAPVIKVGNCIKAVADQVESTKAQTITSTTSDITPVTSSTTKPDETAS